MSINLTNAKVYVARALGNSADADQLSAAADAINAAIEEWNLRHDWRYLAMDTFNGFTVASCTTGNGSPVVTTGSASFFGVNPGITVTGSGVPNGTTVLSVQSSSQITMSQNATAGGTVTLTFGGDIPLVAGTNTYNMPYPIKRVYDARLTVNERTLIWKDQREIDRLFGSNLNTQGVPEFFNTFNFTSFSALNAPNGVIRIYRTPSASDTLRVRFYRPIAEPVNGNDLLDVLDRYVYALLDLAKYYYMRDHDADNPRTSEIKERAEKMFRMCWQDDTEGSEEADRAFVPQIEHNLYRRFDPDLPFGGV